MAAESESVAESDVHLAGLSLVEGEIDIRVDLVVGREVVDGGRDHVFLDGHYAGDAFDGPGCSQQVSGHGFGAADVQFRGVIAEHTANGQRLADIPQRGGGSVGIDIIHRFGRDFRLPEGIQHDFLGSDAFGMRRGDVVGIGGHAAADDFSVYVRAARNGMISRFHHERSRPLPDHEAVAVPVEGA